MIGSNRSTDVYGFSAPDPTRGVLTGKTVVDVGVRHLLLNRWTSDMFGYNGQVMTTDANGYAGLTMVRPGAMFAGQAQPRGGGSPFGSPAGEVVLDSGQLGLYAPNASAVEPVRKGSLVLFGGCVLRTCASDGGVADLTFDKIGWVGSATLTVYTERGRLGSPTNRIRFASYPPSPDNGVIPPWMVSPDGFLNYDSKFGIVSAPFTRTAINGQFPKGLDDGKAVVEVRGACSLADNPNINALLCAADINASAKGDTLTIKSGGLIQDTPNTTIKPNLVFGSPDQLSRAFIYRADNGWWGCAEISGKITADGITKFGRGFTRLTNPNNDIRNTIVCNEGVLSVLGGSGTIGGKDNEVMLNGGGFAADGKDFPNVFKLGLAGGYLENVSISGSITDLPQKPPGPLRLGSAILSGHNTWSGGLYLNGQEVRFLNSYSLPESCPTYVRWGTVWFQPQDKAKGVDKARMTLAANGSKLALLGDLSLGSLDGEGSVSFADGKAALTVGTDDSDFELHGDITEDAQTHGEFTKTGKGTMIYSGKADHSGLTRTSKPERLSSTAPSPEANRSPSSPARPLAAMARSPHPSRSRAEGSGCISAATAHCACPPACRWTPRARS